MPVILLLLLIQAQTPTVEDQIAKFVKGDAAAREALIKLGAAAIRPLQGARDKAPDKIDELVYELKKAAAYPKMAKPPAALEVKCKLQMSGQKPADVVAYLVEFTGCAIVCDRFEAADLKVAEVDLMTDDIPVRQALDQLCRDTGLDYGFFHGVIVMGKPERLWGAGKTPPAWGPPAADRQDRTPAEDKILEHLRSMKINLDFQGATVKTAAEYMQEISSIGFEVDDPAAKPIPVFRLKDASIIDATSLATQMRDLDFIIKDGKVVVGPRDAIAKKVAGKK